MALQEKNVKVYRACGLAKGPPGPEPMNNNNNNHNNNI
jgi:hypothetical protein